MKAKSRFLRLFEQFSTAQIILQIKNVLGFNTDIQLADWIGVTGQAFHAAKKRGSIPMPWIEAIERKLGYTLEDLMKTCTVVEERPVSELDDFCLIPLVAATLSAGTGSLETDGLEVGRYAFRKDWIRTKGNPAKMVLMRTSGDSMEPEIHHNDMVLIDQGNTRVIPYDIYAVTFGDAIYIKQVRPLPGNILQLHSFNPQYQPINIDLGAESPDYCRIIGKAVWVGHDL